MASIVAPLARVHAAAPTTQQIQDDYDSKQYQQVIRDVAQALPLTADPSKGYDKSALLALKGESHLQLRQYSPAVQAYDAASKEASDPQTAAIYRALSVLIHKSTAGQYQPRQPTTRPVDAAGGKPAPIDIIDMNSRGDAMGALLADETKVMTARVEPLKNQNSLAPLMDGIKQLGDLHAVELAVTGKDETSGQLMSPIAGRAADLMTQQLTLMSANVGKLQKEATQPGNTVQTSPYGMGAGAVSQRGLNSSEINSLNDVIDTANKIIAACDDFTKAMQTSASPFDSVKTTATALVKHANDVLHADYSGTATPTTPPGEMPHHHHGNTGQD
jgi:hypothetical protein